MDYEFKPFQPLMYSTSRLPIKHYPFRSKFGSKSMAIFEKQYKRRIIDKVAPCNIGANYSKTFCLWIIYPTPRNHFCRIWSISNGELKINRPQEF